MANEIAKQGPKYALVKTKFDLEANKVNYQKALQHLTAIKVTKDNVNDDLAKEGREVLKALIETKEAETAEPLQWHRDVLSAFNSLYDPLEEQVKRIAAEKKKVAEEIKLETMKQQAEQNRINDAKTAIVDFSNKVANLIAAAKTDGDIVAIEKMIGLEKTKKTVYQEFLTELVEKCDALRPQIKDQKENIRKLQQIEEREKAALETGDILTATQMKEEKEQMQEIIQDTGIRIHETAYDQATSVEVIVPEVADVAPKGRTNWKWRVDDIRQLQKKMPHLVKLVPDEAAINILLSTKRQDGSLDGKMEEKLFGLTFFNDKTYK